MTSSNGFALPCRTTYFPKPRRSWRENLKLIRRHIGRSRTHRTSRKGLRLICELLVSISIWQLRLERNWECGKTPPPRKISTLMILIAPTPMGYEVHVDFL